MSVATFSRRGSAGTSSSFSLKYRPLTGPSRVASCRTLLPVRDSVEIEIFANLYHSIAEEMGAALRRTAFSPNIKERRDYSCAVFDRAGEVIAMGDHMPVHLGSMPMSVGAVLAQVHLEPGDVAMLNDPFSGGTHLPDITLVAPVFVAPATGDGIEGSGRRRVSGAGLARRKRWARTPHFYVASRAHHADVGGSHPGSMGLCREIYQEGFRIPPVRLVRAGAVDRDVLALLLNNVRTAEEREGDLRAQLAACHTGQTRLQETCTRYGRHRAERAAGELLEYSQEMMRAFLASVPRGTFRAEDFLDNDGINGRPVRIAVSISFNQRTADPGQAAHPLVTVDFTGSDPQVEGSINAVKAITYSACFYVFRCLLAEEIPATAGLMHPIRVIAPAGTVVHARAPAAVAGGNVETSQRIVDVLLRALAQAIPDRIPAACSGTMNNLTIGGVDPRTNEPFAYYETIAGGMGARPTKDGIAGVHTHMTNSLNTPAEALEYAYPLRVRGYRLRRGSGGMGKNRGGDGIVREIEVLTDAEVTLLAERRSRGPYGLAGGAEGAPGKCQLIRSGASIEMPGKFNVRLRPGERIRIETPGGGGWGSE
ncbi:MAG: hydantoinase B/oxoprolinase family protein [Acidobacteria bacterium]|nr:hydantoinase B/oxoprolinase family protein [Acidobacteriota bacterium]